MEVKEGQFYYRRHRNMWGVYKKGKVQNGVGMDDFVSDFVTQIQAKTFVYRMNGWKI